MKRPSIKHALNAYRLLVIAVGIALSCTCMAQNNPYKINDSLYPLYMKAYRIRSDKASLPIANTMYKEAVRLGDRKAQVMALIIPMLYYQYQYDETNFERALKTMQAKAQEYGYEQYFYFGMTSKVNFLSNAKRAYEAYMYVNGMEEYARKHNHLYGMYAGLDALGILHYGRSEMSLAIQCYKQALEIGTKYLPEQDMGSMHRRIAECYEELQDFKNMLLYAQQGYPLCKSQAVKLRTLRATANAALMLGKDDLFEHYYEQFCKENGRKPNVHSKEYPEYEMAVMWMLHNHDYEQAGKYIPIANKFFPQRHERLCELYERQVGQYGRLSKRLNMYYTVRIGKIDSIHSASNTEIDAHFINMHMEYENRQLATERQRILNERQAASLKNANLELTNTRLSLRNSSLELGRAKAKADMLRLANSNKWLEAERLRNQIKETNAQHAAERVRVGMILAIMAILIVSGILLARVHKHVTRRLKHTNRQLARNHHKLTEARNKAVAADNVKTVLIKNMKSDITKHLDSIVKMSRMLTERDAKHTPEKRAEIFAHIRRDTEQMLKYVGEVLEKAQK